MSDAGTPLVTGPVPEHLAADLRLALAAALRAGRAVQAVFGTEMAVHHKAPGQPVTEADLEADRVLRAALEGERPEYGWLSEESRDDAHRLGRARVWIVDPVDGTRSFIEGVSEFAISVGLAASGVAVLGVVHNPARGELYWAVRGGGAYLATSWRGGVPLEPRRLAVRADAGPRAMLASRHEMEDGEFDALAESWRLVPTGSTAYKLARLAAGDAHAFLSRGPKSEWDVCGGALLVEEAGGRVTDLRGRGLRYNKQDASVYGILATNGRVHDDLLATVATLTPTARIGADVAGAGPEQHAS